MTVRPLLLAIALIAGILIPAISTPQATAERAAPGDAGIGVRLVDVPTATAEDPRARSYIIDHVRPGKIIERRIEVVNNGATEASVAVYPAAASVIRGSFVGAEGRTQNDLSSWTTTDPDSLRLNGQGRALVKVRIQVPADAERGERYGVIWAETTTPPQEPGGVTQVSRVGIRLYLSVGPGGAPKTDFKITALTGGRDDTNAPLVQATIDNTGERALDLTGSVSLSKGPAGLSAGPFAVPLGTTLGVGESVPVAVPLDRQLPDGPWVVTIKVKSGLVERTAKATLTFPAQPGTTPPVPTDDAPHPFPWKLAAAVIAALLLLALAGYLLLRRKKRNHTPTNT